MKNIFKLLNVKNETEFETLVESLNLDFNQYVDFMNILSNSGDESFIKEQLLNTTINYGNGSYEKLKEQFSKKPFKRELKENNNVLPFGTYNIIVSNIEVDDYEEGEYNIHGEKELTINHDISNDLDEEIKEAILEDMGEPINGSIEVINYDYQIVDKNNKEKIEEDTVYDHSWYEVKKRKYPKRTKDGVVIKEGKSDDYTIHCIVNDLKKNNKNLKFDGNTENLLKLMNQISKEYEVEDYISNKVVCELFGLNYSKFKLLKEALEDEEVKNDTTEVKEPKQKSSADPEITKFINTTNSVVDNTTNADILKGIVDSINMKLAMVTDIEQSNQLGELKQKAETKLVSAKNIKTINESAYEDDRRLTEHDIYIIKTVSENFTPYVKDFEDDNLVNDKYYDILIADKKSSFEAWMYANVADDPDYPEIGWSKDIFYMNDAGDRQQYYIQNEVYDVAVSFVEDYMARIPTKEYMDDPEDDGSEWLEESVQGYATFNNGKISIPVKVHDIDWDLGDISDYDSESEYLEVEEEMRQKQSFVERYDISIEEIQEELLGSEEDDIIQTIFEILGTEIEYTLDNKYNFGTYSWDFTMLCPTKQVLAIVKDKLKLLKDDIDDPESSGEEFDESYLSESNEDNSWLDNAKFQMDQKLVDSKGDVWYIDNIMYYKPDGQYSYSLTNIENPEYMLLYKEDELMQDFTLYNEEPKSTGEEFDESYDPSNDEPNFEIGDKVRFKWGKETYEGSIIKISYVGKVEYYDISVYNSEKERVETFTRVDPISNEMKEIIHNEEIDETCSAGATGVANVSGFAKNIGKVAKRKKSTSESFDVKLFKESIINDMPCITNVNNHTLRYFENNGKFYMGVDNALVKTYDKGVMIEAVDNVVYNELSSINLLEDYSCYEMETLMETEEI